MSSKNIGLVVLPRGKPVKNLPREVNLSRASTASELYQHLATLAGTSVHRLRVTKGSDGQFIPNSKDVTISQTGLMGDSKIYVKDLGMVLFIHRKSVAYAHYLQAHRSHGVQCSL